MLKGYKDYVLLQEISAADITNNRPIFQALVNKIRQQRVSKLVIRDTGRISRDAGQWEAFRELLNKYNVEVETVWGLDMTMEQILH